MIYDIQGNVRGTHLQTIKSLSVATSATHENSSAIIVDNRSCAPLPIIIRWFVEQLVFHFHQIVRTRSAYDIVSCLLNCSCIYTFLILFYTQRVINTHIFEEIICMRPPVCVERGACKKRRKMNGERACCTVDSGRIVYGWICISGLTYLKPQNTRRRLSMHARTCTSCSLQCNRCL